MDILTWFTSAAVSTIIAAAISMYFNWIIKSNEHKFEYKKYILEKRKIAYNHVEEIHSIIISEYVILPGLYIPNFVNTKDESNPIEELNYKVNQCLLGGFWLSDEMFTEMESLNQLLGEMQQYVDTENVKKTSFEVAANEPYSSKFKSQAQRIATVFFQDICSLDDIETFKRKKLLY